LGIIEITRSPCIERCRHHNPWVLGDLCSNDLTEVWFLGLKLKALSMLKADCNAEDNEEGSVVIVIFLIRVCRVVNFRGLRLALRVRLVSNA
jgi:hypothetical protein